MNLLLMFYLVAVSYSFHIQNLHVGTYKNSNPTLKRDRLQMLESGRNLKFNVQGGYLSYDLFYASNANEPQIMYLPGLIREKNEAKSINLQALCKKNDMTFLSADYYGVGRSSGNFADGSISRWTDDAIQLINSVLNKSGAKKVILVGHGLGTWISFLIAQKWYFFFHFIYIDIIIVV